MNLVVILFSSFLALQFLAPNSCYILNNSYVQSSKHEYFIVWNTRLEKNQIGVKNNSSFLKFKLHKKELENIKKGDSLKIQYDVGLLGIPFNPTLKGKKPISNY